MRQTLPRYRTLLDVPNLPRGILLDAYGVFWGGNAIGLLEGAKEAMDALVKQGKVIGIISNTTQLEEKEIDKFKAHGLIQGTHFHFFISSGEVAKGLLQNGELPFKAERKSYFLFGKDHPKFSSHRTVFSGSPFHEVDDPDGADFIYIAIPNHEGNDLTSKEELELLKEPLKKLQEKKIPMLCSNPDLFAHEGNPPKKVIRQGSVAALYASLGGTVHYTGKPYPLIMQLAMKRFLPFGIQSCDEMIMVGDTPETDIAAAKGVKMQAILVLTGMMHERLKEKSLDEILSHLKADQSPDILIERL